MLGRRAANDGVLIEPQILIDPIEIFIQIDEPPAHHELMSKPMAGRFAEAPRFKVVESAIFGIDVANGMNAIADAAGARSEVGIDCLVLDRAAFEFELSLARELVKLL